MTAAAAFEGRNATTFRALPVAASQLTAAADKLSTGGQADVAKVLTLGVDGLGPFKSAHTVAQESLTRARGDVDAAIARVIRVHVRLSGTTGFATGLGGLVTMPVTLPAGVTAYHVLAARLVAAIADLHGHDLESDDVRSAILLRMLGSAGTERD